MVLITGPLKVLQICGNSTFIYVATFFRYNLQWEKGGFMLTGVSSGDV